MEDVSSWPIHMAPGGTGGGGGRKAERKDAKISSKDNIIFLETPINREKHKRKWKKKLYNKKTRE